MTSLWYIFQKSTCRETRVRRQPYIPRGWETEAEAQAWLDDMLLYSQGTKWMDAFVVRERAVKRVVISGLKQKAPPAEADGAP